MEFFLRAAQNRYDYLTKKLKPSQPDRYWRLCAAAAGKNKGEVDTELEALLVAGKEEAVEEPTEEEDIPDFQTAWSSRAERSTQDTPVTKSTPEKPNPKPRNKASPSIGAKKDD